MQMEYQYKHGDRPLEGYTVQQAVGRGGFGEVYYALSDGGREVALKAVQGYEEIELRGIAQCMNLKSPHLVTIFDVKRNEQGRAFVIMEYVAGPSLRELIDQSPGGLGVQKSAFFLREIAKGLTFLHDRGIVHRDLKPGNIFFEDGCVKIGDYGLSKAISPSQHSGHTITVGTVHYMAPEIGAGIYDAKIDIYALGTLLYEMLTGQPPYLGASVGEILMKHLANEPDVSGIEEPFASVIKKAMARNPLDRYGSAQEVVEAVFGAEHVRNSVSCFSPGTLSMVARRVGQKVRTGASGSSAAAGGGYQPRSPSGSDFWTRLDQSTDRVADQVGQIVDRLKSGAGGAAGSRSVSETPTSIADPLSPAQRKKLAVVVTAAMALGGGLIAPSRGGFHIESLGILTMIWGTYFGIWLTLRKLWPQLAPPSPALGRLVATATACMFGMVISTGFWAEVGAEFHRLAFARTWLAIGTGLVIRDWWKATRPDRYERVSLGLALSTALVGLVVALLADGSGVIAMAVLAGTCVVTQLLSPFDPTVARPKPHAAVVNGDVHLSPGQPVPTVVNGNVWVNEGPPIPKVVNGNIYINSPGSTMPDKGNDRGFWYPIPAAVRVLFLVGFIGLLTLGAMLFISLGFIRYDDEEQAIALCSGIGAVLFSIFCLVHACSATYRHWWSSFVKPILMIVCVLTAAGAGVCLGVLRMDNDVILVAIFLMVFPSILFVVLAAIPYQVFERGPGPRLVDPATPAISPYKRVWALLLAAGCFVGIAGLHRFYVGKIVTGILWLVTWGLFGIGQFIDAILIVVGQFKDAEGRVVTKWERESAPASPRAAVPASPAEPSPAVPPAVWSRMPRQTSLWLSLVAGLILAVTIAVGTVFLVGVKASRIAVDPATAQRYQRTFGTPDWPEMLHDGGIAVIVILTMAAGAILIIGRRKAGARHMIRAGLGTGGLILSVFVFDEVFQAIPRIYGGRFGPGNVRLVVEEAPLIFAGLVFLLSIMTLVWPEKREAVPSLPSISEGVAQ